MNLVSTMSQVYPDYDFEGLKPEHFDRCPDLNTVVNSINHNLAIVVPFHFSFMFFEHANKKVWLHNFIADMISSFKLLN